MRTLIYSLGDKLTPRTTRLLLNMYKLKCSSIASLRKSTKNLSKTRNFAKTIEKCLAKSTNFNAKSFNSNAKFLATKTLSINCASPIHKNYQTSKAFNNNSKQPSNKNSGTTYKKYKCTRSQYPKCPNKSTGSISYWKKGRLNPKNFKMTSRDFKMTTRGFKLTSRGLSRRYKLKERGPESMRGVTQPKFKSRSYSTREISHFMRASVRTMKK